MNATPALDARKGRILAAIIQEYIHSAEPAASEAGVRRQIHSLAEEAERLIQGAARALAEEVHYPSVIATVRPQEHLFRHLHFVPLDAHRVLGGIVTDAGVFEG